MVEKNIDVSRYIRPQSVIADLRAETKEEAIRQLVNKAFAVDPSCTSGRLTRNEVYAAVMDRENIQTTGLGNGVAFPHARIEACSDLVVVIGISQRGVDFGSLDGKPCHFISLMISPVDKPYIILQMMASLSRFFVKPENLEVIKRQTTAAQIVETLLDSMQMTTRMVLACDLMQPPEHVVSLETSIEECAHMMHLNKLDALPVVDEHNQLCGEISCLDIFTYSIPDFFSRLQTVSFVRHLDPFEKYFRLKRDLKVKDLYVPSTRTISEDTTLMEIVFEMTTNNKSRLYVVDESGLVGVVDRFTVIDRILFF